MGVFDKLSEKRHKKAKDQAIEKVKEALAKGEYEKARDRLAWLEYGDLQSDYREDEVRELSEKCFQATHPDKVEQAPAEKETKPASASDSQWGNAVQQMFAEETDKYEQCCKDAEQGDAEAQYRLGEMYLLGSGVDRDSAQASHWLRMAADQGHAGAQYLLGLQYRKGNGVPQDDEEALKWYTLAAEQGHKQAKEYVKVMLCKKERAHAEEQYTRGMEYYKKSDYDAAAECFRAGAELGHIGSIGRLGYQYVDGLGVEQDEAKGIEYLRKAAEQNDADAQFLLAYCYRLGNAVSQDREEAIKWFRAAAEQGHDRAAKCLSTLLRIKAREEERAAEAEAEQAVEVPSDEPEKPDAEAPDGGEAAFAEGCRLYSLNQQVSAAQYFLKAARQGHVVSQCNMGVAYSQGLGVDADPAEAVKWFRAAAEQGHVGAQSTLGDRYRTGDGVEQDMAEAAHWYRLAAEQGDVVAQVNLAVMYTMGTGVDMNLDEAELLARMAADNGHEKASELLEKIRAKREQLEESGEAIFQRGLARYEKGGHASAAACFRTAANRGHADAQFALGVMYDTGDGVEQDKAEAVRWYRMSAEQGHTRAQDNLGLMYDNGDGVEQDKAEAVRWYRKAAEQGLANAQFALGVMYNNGDGVEQDQAEAARWFRMAAEQGHTRAQAMLAIMYARDAVEEQDLDEAERWARLAKENGAEKMEELLDLIEKCKVRKNTLDLGDACYQNGDYAEAARHFRTAAEQGSASAQAYLALMYAKGEGVGADMDEAERWARLAKEGGAEGMDELLDMIEAYKADKKAFDLGVACYQNGDYAEAARHFRTLAEQGSVKAQFNLAVMYATGDGVEQDLSEAEKWAQLAVESGVEEAEELLQRIRDMR